MSDEERNLIMMRMLMEIMGKASQKGGEKKRELSKDEIINIIRRITKGDRAEEIINNALSLYGENAIQVFRQLVELYLNGKLSELQDFELYQILERFGMHVPVKTKIRIVRHGREESIGND